MPSSNKRWVVKAGSQMVCAGGPLLLRAWMHQVAQLKQRHGIEVIWVTSGAIASAVERTRFAKRTRTLEEKQALSAIGQPMVMDLYNLALNASGLTGAQILLTYEDLAHAERRRNFQNTVNTLLEWNAVPILNENDAVATQEIRFGDNDSLSAKVARYAGAERLVILTDVDGLYDRDPRRDKNARLLPELKAISRAMLAQTSSASGSSRGTGGMYSKLKAAQEASRAGVETWLARGDRPSVLLEVAQNFHVGTRIPAARKRRTK